MSYCFDTLSAAWAELQSHLPLDVQGSELAMRFTCMLEELHDANHRLSDAVNKDGRVTTYADKLSAALQVHRAWIAQQPMQPQDTEPCPHPHGIPCADCGRQRPRTR